VLCTTILGTIGRNLPGALDLCTSAVESVAKSVHIRHLRIQSEWFLNLKNSFFLFYGNNPLWLAPGVQLRYPLPLNLVHVVTHCFLKIHFNIIPIYPGVVSIATRYGRGGPGFGPRRAWDSAYPYKRAHCTMGIGSLSRGEAVWARRWPPMPF